MPKAYLDVVPDIARAFAAKIFPSFVAVGCRNIRVRIAGPGITVLIDNRPVILGHFTCPAMRVRVVDAGKNLLGPLDVEIAPLLDLIGASSGYAGLAVDNKQATAPFVVARQAMLCRMGRRKGKDNCKGRRYGSPDHLIIRCEAAGAAGHCWVPPRAHVERSSAG